jgi:hypothetical protein
MDGMKKETLMKKITQKNKNTKKKSLIFKNKI